MSSALRLIVRQLSLCNSVAISGFLNSVSEFGVQPDTTFFCVVFCGVWKSIALFQGSQASPACPKSIIRIKVSMEHWWNGIDKGKRKDPERNLSQCHIVHHKSRMGWRGIGVGIPRAAVQAVARPLKIGVHLNYSRISLSNIPDYQTARILTRFITSNCYFAPGHQRMFP